MSIVANIKQVFKHSNKFINIKQLNKNETHKYLYRPHNNLSLIESKQLFYSRYKNEYQITESALMPLSYNDFIVDFRYKARSKMHKFVIEKEDYSNYLEKANYKLKYPNYYPDNLPEKSFEHYLATKFLKLNNESVFLDVASECSPCSDIFSQLNNAKCFSQDIMYEKGLHGNMIGSCGSQIPLHSASVDAILLSCSIEHFEGNSDTETIIELYRLLKPSGKILITPLYTATKPCTWTSPVVASSNVSFDDDTIIYYNQDWGNRHGRHYSLDTLLTRVINHIDGEIDLYFMQNTSEIDPTIYCSIALVITKK